MTVIVATRALEPVFGYLFLRLQLLTNNDLQTIIIIVSHGSQLWYRRPAAEQFHACSVVVWLWWRGQDGVEWDLVGQRDGAVQHITVCWWRADPGRGWPAHHSSTDAVDMSRYVRLRSHRKLARHLHHRQVRTVPALNVKPSTNIRPFINGAKHPGEA